MTIFFNGDPTDDAVDNPTPASQQRFSSRSPPLVSEPLLQVTFASSAPDHRESEVDELIIAIQCCAI